MRYDIRALLTTLLFAGGLHLPAVAQSKHGTFYVEGRYLFDPCGEKVILRGANAMVVYWNRHGDRIYPELAKTGANVCRIFWATGHEPEPVMPAADLDITLANCWASKMIPMPSLWDASGKWENLDMCVDYWLRDDVLAVLKKHQKYMLLNIANEAGSGVQSDFASKYAEIILRLRNAGLHCPLVIDADGYGRHFQALIEHGPWLLEQDPGHNLIFSWHIWDPSHWGNGSKEKIKEAIDQSIEKDICFIIGEFGPCEQCGNCSNTKIEWEYMIEYGHEKEIGWLAWVWRWDDCHGIVTTRNDSYGAWANPGWGEQVAVSHEKSILNTAHRTNFIEQKKGDGVSP